MTAAAPAPKRQSRLTLRRQALWRLVTVAAALTLIISLVGYGDYHTRQQREVEQKRIASRDHYATVLPQLESTWLTQAEQLRARIEFTRILEEPETVRWAKLNAFLTAQWEYVEFSNIAVTTAGGDIIYRYGSEMHRIPPLGEALARGWYYDSDQQEVYRVLATPLWLGKAGHGQLVVLKTMNPALLRALAVPETRLHLHVGERLLASSSGDTNGTARPGNAGYHAGQPAVVQFDLAWPPGGADAPTLVVQREFTDAVPLAETLMRPLLAILLVLLMVWLGLGRWLTRSVRRIEALDAAARTFAAHGAATAASQALVPAHANHDEIGDVADTLETLMHEVGQRELDQRAYLDTLAMLEEAVLELDGDARIVRASPGWQRLTNRDENVIGTPFGDFFHADDAGAVREMCDSFRRGDKQHAIMRLRLGNNTSEQWTECRLVPQSGPQGELAGIRGVVRDITQTYLHEKQITHMALHDTLTDLPNRVLLEDRIKIATRMASRGEHKVAACFIDLDHFKKINDSLGHKAGDRLLVAFSRVLRSQLRAGDTLARWGGDEFVLLLPELDSQADAREVARKVTQVLQQPLPIDDAEYLVTFSMGIAVYPDDTQDVDVLLAHADRAMFYAKAQGRNQTCFFGEVADKGSGRRELYIQNKLAAAVGAEQIQAWFQPIVAAAGGDCRSVEVLARWHDAEFGWVSPATFIPIAENTGTIRVLGHQVWMQALQALTHWRRRGKALRLAVNISKRQLFAPHVAEELLAELKRANLAPDDIMLEITESVALLDVANASDRLRELHRLGFHVAIDDFGTGYSSLSQLHEMPVDELKIDISFVRRIHEPVGRSMVQAIVQLAGALGLSTTAEGVEDEDSAMVLRSLGADFLQGYHFAKPMPRAEFDNWLLGR